MIQASNTTTTVSFDGAVVTIDRQKGNGFLPAGARTIPLAQIAAIRWFDARGGLRARGGYMRFVIAGTVEKRYSQTALVKTDLLKDENAVPFSHRQQPEFEKLKAAIDAALASLPAAGPAGPLSDSLD